MGWPKTYFVWAALVLALGGCAGMDAAECRTADWRAIGYEDGAAGKEPGAFGERRKACAEAGVTANFDAYMAGRTEGLAYFCRPHNAYELGTRGYRYTGICPAALEEGFLVAYADGHGLYARRAELNRIGYRLDRSRKRAKEIEHLLVDKTAQLVGPDLDVPARAAMAIDLKNLTEEKVQLETQIGRLERDYARAQYEYDSYRNQMAARPTY